MNGQDCALCGEPVDVHDHRLYQKIEGWEQHRAQGGANQITLRRPLGPVAHAACIDLARKGLDVNQGSML